jgi:hypothetical protein
LQEEVEMLVDVTVKVQEDRLAEFYAMYGEWFAAGSTTGPPRRVRQEWAAGDSALARSAWERFPNKPRDLLELLLAESELDSEAIVSRLGLKESSQVTGLAGWVARVCNEFGRGTPVKTRPIDGGGTAWRVESTVARMFEEARQAVEAEGR